MAKQSAIVRSVLPCAVLYICPGISMAWIKPCRMSLSPMWVCVLYLQIPNFLSRYSDIQLNHFEIIRIRIIYFIVELTKLVNKDWGSAYFPRNRCYHTPELITSFTTKLLLPPCSAGNSNDIVKCGPETASLHGNSQRTPEIINPSK